MMHVPGRAGPAQGWPRAIVFDLDGTLVDSAPDIRTAINGAFAPLGVPPFDLPDVVSMIGGGAPAAVARAASLAGLKLSAADTAALLARFYPIYAEASSAGRGLYPGAHDLLQGLRASGVTLALCTNKAQAVTDVAIKALGVATYFTAVIGARDDLPKKPAPDPVLMAMAALGATAVDSIMVGDSTADVGAARAAGIPVVAVAHGYAKMPPSELGADSVAEDLTCVHSAIEAVARLRFPVTPAKS